jgi:hypothetical protein
MAEKPAEQVGAPIAISLRDANGQQTAATVVCGLRDWSENGLRHTECRVTLTWNDVKITGIDMDFFDAFCRVREQLATFELLPVCYGASRRVFISGMARDMGLGRRIYKILPDNSTSIKHLVNIFDTGADVEPVSVEEQHAFMREWVTSSSNK